MTGERRPMDGFEYEVWREAFEGARRILGSLLRGPEDWERVKRGVGGAGG